MIIEKVKEENSLMSQLLESIMLICFGISWPLSVYKNIKAHSAKGMSLSFNLMIVAGYIAGISAKIFVGAFNYVLAIYIINLIAVSANIVVYFINRSYDRQNEQLRGKLYSRQAA